MDSKHNLHLKHFQLDAIREEDAIVSEGTYTITEDLDLRGTKCAGKKIQRMLYETAQPKEKANMLRRFDTECELLGQLGHPNIVQFLGVYLKKSQLPMLVMEYLPHNLSDCLERHGVFPLRIGYSILKDVALGLRYLHEHSPSVIHRNLSANNVLLTASMSAKIAELGVAKIVNMSPVRAAQITQAEAPSIPTHVAPEAMMAKPKYTTKVDIFSFGVLTLHVLSGERPTPIEVCAQDPESPGKVILLSEYERRCKTVGKMKNDCPLLGLIKQCLNNTARSRPSAAEVDCKLREVYSQVSSNAEEGVSELLPLRIQSLQADMEQHLKEIDRMTVLVCEANMELRDSLMAHEDQIATLLAEQRRATAALKAEKESELAAMLQVMKSEALQAEQSATIELYEAKLKEKDSKIRRMHSEITCLSTKPMIKWKSASVTEMKLSEASSAASLGGTKKIYVQDPEGGNIVYQYLYESEKDTCIVSALPACPVSHCATITYMGKLVTVGGRRVEQLQLTNEGPTTGKVHQFLEHSQEWGEFLPPMPTAREQPSVVTVPSSSSRLPVIVACGGCTDGGIPCSTVEVFSYESATWSAACPLPVPCYNMTSVTIGNACYLLGGRGEGKHGISHCFSCSFDSLLCSDNGAHSPISSSHWCQITSTPQILSTAASLGGSLLAIGGRDPNTCVASTAVYALSEDNFWDRVRGGDLPGPCCMSTALCLPSGKVLVIGGFSGDKLNNNVFVSYIE